MSFSITNRRLIIVLVSAFILAVVSDIISESDIKYTLEAKFFENKLHKAEKKSLEYLQKLSEADSLFDSDIFYEEAHDERICAFFRYAGDSLAAWTGNNYSIPASYDPELFNEKFIRLENHRVLVNRLRHGDDIFICLIDIYRDYDISNKYIESGFNPVFGLNLDTELGTDREEGYAVHDTGGKYLFSLEFDRGDNFLTSLSVFPVVLWLVFLVVFLMLIDRLAGWIGQKGFPYLSFLSSLQAVLILYLVFLLLDKPGIFTRMEIFLSFRFNPGPLVPSPGHLLLLSIFFLFACFEFYRHFPGPACEGEKHGKKLFIFILYLSVASFIFFIFSRLLYALILESNIYFRIFEILDIDIFSVVTLSSALLIIAGLNIYLLKLASLCSGLSIKTLLTALVISSALLHILHFLFGAPSIIHILAFILLVLQVWIFRADRGRLVNISVTFAIIAAAYTAYLIPRLTWLKETEKLKVITVNYSNQNDIYGEGLLLDMWEDLESDSLLQAVMSEDFLSHDDVNSVYSYLDNEYFNGYWDNYDRIYTICEDDSPLFFENDTGRVENCFEFFRTRIGENGVMLRDSNLVFLDNKSGRPYYMGCIYYEKPGGGMNGLFIELISLVRYTQSGYPELLIDDGYDKQVNTGDYSIAKYINDSLVMQTGDYPFDNYLSLPLNDTTGFTTVPGSGNREYFIYTDGKVSVVVVRHHVDFMDIVVTFTYILIASLIIFLLALFIIRPPHNIFPGRLNFTQKLQISFIGILLGSLVAIGTVVVILSIKQYHGKHYENIEEKLGSVYIELDHKLSGLDTLSNDWQVEGYASLDELLIKFSNVFKTDINLYNTSGELMASSRREMFEKELKSERMDFLALSRLKYDGAAQFIHEERIGSMEYLSAYAPFVNSRNEVLAYLNLPYFNMQSRISRETSNLIAAMINFSVIMLVISLSIAAFISVRITAPLRMLQKGLASVKLEEKSQPLEYRGHDEISELVRQYNEMLDELQASAVKLARSEREYAWREMAKQIAHEIKNPLTPMKLNVQQLYKKWKDSPKDFDDSLKKFTQYQIEQIDNLSSIATEFSNFARMPKTNPRETDLVGHIHSVAELYSDIRNIDFEIDLNGLKEVLVYADKEQMNSMLSNIFRNAVQSIPGNKKGLIRISLSVKNDKALISVEDNGVGIPEELKDKLFAPNFTTKSSGMGLGLAIVKRVVETANGRVWFESKAGRGSTFYIEYPVLSYA
ncbi:MAG: ATP-binding protein [Bacteroidales bacterium]